MRSKNKKEEKVKIIKIILIFNFFFLTLARGVGIVDTLNLAFSPCLIYRDGNWLYYGCEDGSGIRKFNLVTRQDVPVRSEGRDLIWIEGNYGFTGEEYPSSNTCLWKFDKSTGNTIWKVVNDDWSFGFAVASDAIYVANGSSGVRKVRKSDGSIIWENVPIGRYCDDVVVDRFRNNVIAVGYWEPTEVARLNPNNGSKIWTRSLPSECSPVVDLTESEVWVARNLGSTNRLEKWSIVDGRTLAKYYDKPYIRIYHLGPEGRLTNLYPDEAGNALVINANGAVAKVKVSTWEIYWEVRGPFSTPMLYCHDRLPFIDSEYIYLRDSVIPSRIYRFKWRGGNNDVGVAEILAPKGVVDSGRVIIPKAIIKNFGAEREAFPIRFKIGRYISAETEITLEPGQIDTVEFIPLVATLIGTHTVKCTTLLGRDNNPANNFLIDSIIVRRRCN